MKILCIFPLSDAVQTIEDALNSCSDLTPVFVHSTHDACAEMASSKFNTIITGHNPPAVDLLILLDYLLSHDIALPVIMVTEEADSDLLKKGMHAGLRTWYPLSDPASFNNNAFVTLIQSIARESSAQQLIEFYRDVLGNAGDLIQSLDNTAHFLYVSQKWKDLLGYSDDEIPDLTLFNILPKENLEAYSDCFKGICSSENNERLKADEAIQLRNAILDAVNYAASSFLRGASWEESIEPALARLGQATGTDRAYIFVNHTDDECGQIFTSYKYEWVSEGTDSYVDNLNLQNISYDEAGYGRWKELFAKELPFAGNVSDFPVSEQAIFTSQNILSLAAVPVFVDGMWWGFIGFDACREEHLWDEIEIHSLQVAAGILGVAIERERRESEIKESEEVFRKPVEQSLVGVYILQDDIIQYTNPFLSSLLGYTREELTSGLKYRDLVVPEQRPFIDQSIENFNSNSDFAQHIEISFLTKDGRRIDTELFNSLLSYHGRPAIVGNLLDITEKKAAEDELRTSLQEKEVLLMEVHHRVKNNLQVLLSMATLQEIYYQNELEKNPLAARILSDMEKRIKAIALVYDHLICSNDFTGIQLHIHLESLVEEVMNSVIGKVYISYFVEGGEDVVIPMDRAVVLSLTINEILTNATRHAFEGRDFGKVTITVYKDSKNPEYLCLDVADDGIGLPSNTNLKTTESVGLSLIYNVVTVQLGGTVELKEGEGTCYMICIPFRTTSMIV